MSDTPLPVDGYLDRSGHFEIYKKGGGYRAHKDAAVHTGELIEGELVCFDVRKLHSLGVPTDRFVYDLKMLYAHDSDLSRLVRNVKIPFTEEFMERERRFAGHTKAISEARMDADNIPLAELLPTDVRFEYMFGRIQAIEELYGKLTEAQKYDYRKNIWPVFQDILKIEQAKIKIDVPYVEKMRHAKDLPAHERKFFESICQTHKDGFVQTRISPVGSKTWRLRVEGGFQCMAIPHGVCRKAIVSRFEGGKILTLDFNAIDYRCLVKATDDPMLNAFYDGYKDFHARTASIFGEVNPKLRDNVKKIAYTHIYGGSTETLQKQTLLPRDELASMLRKLDELFAPITRFRKEMSDKAREVGYVLTPGMQHVVVEPGDHDGKIVGLYGQSYSSAVFNRALYAVHQLLAWDPDRKSKVIFTVHDELVIDLHPSEFHVVPMLVDTMEAVTGFVVKSKEGVSYGEATDG